MKVLDNLSRYLVGQFFKGFLTAYICLASIILLFDSVELMRRAAGRSNISFSKILQMGLLKLPQMMEMLLPFVFLFGAMFAFWRLNRSQELVVIRTGGISVWQFLKPAVLVASCWGLLQIVLFNPFSAALYSRYAQLEAKYFEQSLYQSSISSDGLWLRQIDDNGTLILHAGVVEPDFGLRDINGFAFDKDYNFLRRIDAQRARLEPNQWVLETSTVTEKSGGRQTLPALSIPSNLTINKIQESFSPPESLSVWELPRFIQVLESSGFSALSHRLYLQTMLTTPFILVAMVLIAACFSISPQRNKKTLFLIVGGIFTGFIYYSFSDIVHALGQSGRIPIMLAAWAPFFVTVFLGTALLLHLEDG